jgi:hypothetical protein
MPSKTRNIFRFENVTRYLLFICKGYRASAYVCAKKLYFRYIFKHFYFYLMLPLKSKNDVVCYTSDLCQSPVCSAFIILAELYRAASFKAHIVSVCAHTFSSTYFCWCVCVFVLRPLNNTHTHVTCCLDDCQYRRTSIHHEKCNLSL